MDGSVSLLEDDEVGEGASGVDADEEMGHCYTFSSNPLTTSRALGV